MPTPRTFARFASTATKRRSVSIIGSGPSGFYTAYRILSKSPVPVDVTIWEKLPIPFGLSRYGVAPDHPEVKNCEDTFTEVANTYSNGSSSSFKFIGNVVVGKDVSLKTLLDKQDAVVLSYGCTGDNKLNIPGEDTATGVFTSREFVNWYNGHPDYATSDKFTSFNWSKVKRVGVIGNGNVALDVARIILSSKQTNIWSHTDISPLALEFLRKAPVEEVKLVARRDFPHSKFTNKEFRELWELEKYGIRGVIAPEFFQLDEFDLQNADRVFKRRVEMCSEYLKPFSQRSKKNFKKFPPPATGYSSFWELDYLKSPLQINTDEEGLIKSVSFSKNRVTPDNKVVHIAGEEVTYDMDLLVTSLGYGGNPLSGFEELGIKFDRNRVANTEGRVLNASGQVFPGLYASGWIRKGSTGVIASTMMDAFQVADLIIHDLQATGSSKTQSIDLKNIKHTTWEDWRKIDAHEKALGKQEGKPRVKLLTSQAMLEFLDK